MKSLRTMLVDELYAHFQHIEGQEEIMGVDTDDRRGPRNLLCKWSIVRRDEGSVMLRMGCGKEGEDRWSSHQIRITVEKE